MSQAQTPGEILNAAIGKILWLIELSLVYMQIAFAWFKEHIGVGFIVSLARFITDCIILALDWILIIIKWLLSMLLLIFSYNN